MDPNVLLPFGSSALSFVFAAFVADQWWRRRQPYQLIWTIGLLWYGISAGTEFLGSAFGWNEPLYRAWYLIGAFGVAAYLGLGTVFLLNRTRFGYFVAFSVFAGGLFSILSGLARSREGDPASAATVLRRRPRRHGCRAGDRPGHALPALAHGAGHRGDPGRRIGASSPSSMLSVPVAAPGYHLDATGVPTGEAFPADLRVLTPPFNIAGAFALVFGAVYSAYIFMPKVRVMRVPGGPPVIGAIGRAVAVVVNFVASLPGAWRALRAGTLNSRVPATILIAIGGFIPGWTSGLNRFGVTWAFFFGELLGVMLHLPRLPRQHRGLQRRAAAVHADRAAAARRRRPGRRLRPTLVDTRGTPSVESAGFPR